MTDENHRTGGLEEAEDLEPQAAETDDVAGGLNPQPLPPIPTVTDGQDRTHFPT